MEVKISGAKNSCDIVFSMGQIHFSEVVLSILMIYVKKLELIPVVRMARYLQEIQDYEISHIFKQALKIRNIFFSELKSQITKHKEYTPLK
jgi:hypothetical protein